MLISTSPPLLIATDAVMSSGCSDVNFTYCWPFHVTGTAGGARGARPGRAAAVLPSSNENCTEYPASSKIVAARWFPDDAAWCFGSRDRVPIFTGPQVPLHGDGALAEIDLAWLTSDAIVYAANMDCHRFPQIDRSVVDWMIVSVMFQYQLCRR